MTLEPSVDMGTQRHTLAEKIESLQNLLVTHATGGRADNADYLALRRELMENPETQHSLPRFVITCRSVDQFWPFIQERFPTYAERRKFIWNEFRPLLDRLDSPFAAPTGASVSEVLSTLDSTAVNSLWHKALDKVESDPEGAITAARALLEAVCKHILEEDDATAENTSELPKLYRRTAERLNLAPSQHTEQLFKQILGGCQAVVEGLGAVRNKLGDAHGRGKNAPKPAPRHAELAVNLAGSMATFLVATWNARTGL